MSCQALAVLRSPTVLPPIVPSVQGQICPQSQAWFTRRQRVWRRGMWGQTGWLSAPFLCNYKRTAREYLKRRPLGGKVKKGKSAFRLLFPKASGV